MVKKVLIAGLLGLLTLAAACGYSFRGGMNNLPPDVRTVAIPVFKNVTQELRIESTFTDEVLFQFTRSQMLRVVDVGEADAVLRGTIMRVAEEDVALQADQTSRERRVTVTLAARLVRRSNGQVLWEDPGMQRNRSFTVTGNVLADERNKQVAIGEVARAMAQTLHDRVFENF